MKFKDYLNNKRGILGEKAREDLIDWVGDMSVSEAWKTCERGDRMLWILEKANLCGHRQLTLIKAECAGLVEDLMQDKRSIEALRAAERYGKGGTSKEQLLEYVASAAYTAAYASAAAAYAAAKVSILRQCAEICRKHIPMISIEGVE